MSRPMVDGKELRDIDMLSLPGYQLPRLQSIAKQLGIRSSGRTCEELIQAIRTYYQEELPPRGRRSTDR